MRARSILVGVAALMPWVAWAQSTPSDKPILRIETGMHTAQIRQIGVNAAERYLASASYDKTVRVWELPSGELLRVLRPPIGEGNEGNIYAIAISPDGHTVACGGATGYEWDNSGSIYLFERESGRLYRRLAGLPEVVQRLAYSPDGRFLVATLGGGHGIRLLRTTDYAQVAEDHDYGDNTYGADFEPASAAGKTLWLATASFDGFIRRYELSGQEAVALRLLAKQKAPGGSRPCRVRFSPDGSRLAVAFDDLALVDVLSATDLSFRYSPDTASATTNLASVAWSKDGEFLYAAGRSCRGGGCPILRWAKGGRTGSVELPGANNTIMDLATLRNALPSPRPIPPWAWWIAMAGESFSIRLP